MGVGAPLIVVAIGSVLCFVVACVAVVVLCLRALRQGNHQFEGEIKAPSMTISIRARRVAGTVDATCDCGAADKQRTPVSRN
jgi:ABC-type sulfate transport system permease subunit